jgi:flagellar assembly factor FliW
MLTIQQNRAEEKVIPVFSEAALEVRFPCGLLGFEQVKQYKLHAFPDLHPFLWLEGQDGNGLCFLVVPPSYVVEYYQIELSDEDVNFLGLEEPEDGVVLNVATFHPDGSITVNLKGPLIYNRNTLVARQVVPKNAATLSIKHPLGN